MDHPGPMARSVRDLAILLQTIAGEDSRDPSCSDRPVPQMVPGPNQTLQPPLLGRLRGLFDDRAEPAVRAMMDRVCERFLDEGGKLTEVALPAGFSEVIARHRTIMAVEGAAFHEQRLRRHPDDYPPKIKGLLEEGLAYPAPEYARCMEFQRRLFSETMGCFTGIDALLCPATTGPAPDAASTGDPAFNSPWSLTGLPTVSIPMGKSHEGLPLGIQLVGPAWGEAGLFQVAAWCGEALA